MRHQRIWLAITASFACFLCVEASAQQWTRFRGDNGNGIATTQSFPAKWESKHYRWQVELPGIGHSSPVIWGNRLFAASGDEASGVRIVFCVDAESGKRLWTREFAASTHRKHRLNSFSSSTPTVDAERVYFCWGTPDEVKIVALDHQGRDVWQFTLDGFRGGHGYGVSPIVYGDLLVIPNEQSGDSSLIALDRHTGDLRWQIHRDSKVAYSTPCVFRQADGREQLVFTNWEQGIVGIRPDDGATVWAADVFDKAHVKTAIGSPVTYDDIVVGVCGWMGVKQQVVAVRVGGKLASPQVSEVWRVERSAPLCTTPLVCRGLVFLWADDGIVTCLDAKTGHIHWRQRVGGEYYASPVFAGGAMFNFSTDGRAVALAADSTYQVLARNELPEGSHATPAVVDGVMYVRTFSKLIAISEPDR